MSWQNVQDPDGHFIGWAPGRGPIVAPDGMPWRLDRGADLVVELHMLPAKKPRAIQPRSRSTSPIAAVADAVDGEDGIEADRHSRRRNATTWSPTSTSCRCRSI